MHICINQLAKAYYTRGDVPYGSASSRYDVIDSMMKILDCTFRRVVRGNSHYTPPAWSAASYPPSAEMDACRIQPPDISPALKHLESDYFQVLLPGHIPYIKKERENITFQSISYQGSFVCILTTPISFATTPHYTTDPLKYIEF